MCWSGSKGETLYQMMAKKGLKMSKDEFEFKFNYCIPCLEDKIHYGNTGHDAANWRADREWLFPNIETNLRGKYFDVVRTKECSRCPFLFGNTEKAAWRLGRLNSELLYRSADNFHFS